MFISKKVIKLYHTISESLFDNNVAEDYYVKDIKDSLGSIKDTHTMTAEKNQIVKDNVFYNLAFFHNDHDILLLYQKVERICGAIFLVSRFIDNDHIIKRTLQESAIMSLRACTEFIIGLEVSSQKLKSVSIHLLALYSHLDNAFWSGVLSQMNTSVIQKEIHPTTALTAKIDERYKSSSNPKNSFLSLLDKAIPSNASTESLKDIDPTKGHIKDTLKDNLVIKDTVKKTHSSLGNQDRTDKIKAILRDFKQRNIKDIASLFPGVSEKTIQREINHLISQGIIKRIGKRRWSTYILA